jgi:hypothetical protein
MIGPCVAAGAVPPAETLRPVTSIDATMAVTGVPITTVTADAYVGSTTIVGNCGE